MTSLSLQSVAGAARRVVTRFPLCCLFGLGLTVALIVQVHTEAFHGVVVWYLSAGCLLSLSLSLWGEEVGSAALRRTVAAVAHAALAADAVALRGLDDDAFGPSLFLAHAAVVVALLLSVCFLPFFRHGDDVASWNFVRRAFVRLFVATVVAQVMTLGVTALIVGTSALLGLEVDRHLMADVPAVTGVLLPLLLWLALIPSGRHKHDEAVVRSGFLLGVTRWLFIPLACCYMAVLYAYLAKILWQWTLPEGAVAWLVTAMMAGIVGVTMLLYPSLRSGQALRVERAFVGVAPLAALPLVVLMTVGIVRRLDDYGLTAPRLYVLTANVWYYVLCLGLALTRARRIHWVALSLGALLLLTSSHPLNYYAIERRTMVHGLEHAFAQWTPTHVPMSQAETEEWLRSVPEAERPRLYSLVQHVCRHYSRDVEAWIARDVYLYDDYDRRAKRDEADGADEAAQVQTLAEYTAPSPFVSIPAGYSRCIRTGRAVQWRQAGDSVLDLTLAVPLSAQSDTTYRFMIPLPFDPESAGVYPEVSASGDVLLSIVSLSVRLDPDDGEASGTCDGMLFFR